MRNAVKVSEAGAAGSEGIDEWRIRRAKNRSRRFVLFNDNDDVIGHRKRQDGRGANQKAGHTESARAQPVLHHPIIIPPHWHEYICLWNGCNYNTRILTV